MTTVEQDHHKKSNASDDEKLLEFHYQIGFHPKRNVLIVAVLHKGKPLVRFERFGIHALSLQDRSSASVLEPAHRYFIQHLFRFAQVDTVENCFIIPRKQVAYFLTRLSHFKQVAPLEGGKKNPFSKVCFEAHLELVRQQENSVSLKVNFTNPQKGEHFDFASAVVFSGARNWILYKGQYHPLQGLEETNFLEDFDAEGKLNLTGRKAADFTEEILPTLIKREEIQLPGDYHPSQVLRVKPEVQYQLSENLETAELILTLHFTYEGHLLPPARDEKDLLAEVDSEGKKLLVRRDLAFEKNIIDKFAAQGFRRIGLETFSNKAEDALDFISQGFAELKTQVALHGKEKINYFQVLGELGRGQLKAIAKSSKTDWFAVEVGFEIENMRVPFEVIRALVAKGENYLAVPGKGFLKVNRDDFISLEESLNELEGNIDEEGNLKLPAYHVPYLQTLMKIDWSGKDSLLNLFSSFQATEKIPTCPLPSTLQGVLRHYQQLGYDWLNFLHNHRFHGILADDMGLGKTLQMLSYLQGVQERENASPHLIIAPTSVVLNWQAEAEKFSPNLKVLLWVGPKRKENEKLISESHLVVTSYAVFRRDAELLGKHDWKSIVLDEAQNIKNYRSKTAQLMSEVKAEQRWALTGTPLENRLSELWSIFNFLMPGFLGSYLHFRRKYQDPIEKEEKADVLERLKKRIYPFVMRRLKQEVAPELPPKTEVVHYCEMGTEQRKLYDQMLSASRKRVFEEVEKQGLEKSRFSILTALLRLRQVCCHPNLLGDAFKKKEMDSGKMEDFKDLLLEILSEGHRVLVFSQFVEMLGILRRFLEDEKISYEYLDGRTRHRDKRIKNFNTDETIPVFLISLKAGGTGLNLTGADYVIHFDPWWNPAVEDQATDRAHRLGQKRHVFSYKLITKESVEEKIQKLQDRKRTLVKGILTTDSAIGKSLNQDDLEYLFS